MATKEEFEQQIKETLQAHPAVAEVLGCAAAKLGLTINDVHEGFLRYDLDFGLYDNEVYDDSRVRLALYLKYFVADSYHITRQKVLSRFLESQRSGASVIDIGYGAPGLYVTDLVLHQSDIHIILADKYTTAESVSTALLDCLLPDKDWKNQVSFRVMDLDRYEDFTNAHDVYILCDSIEHAKDPTKSLKLLVERSKHDSTFIFSLPITPGSSIQDNPAHFICWDTQQEAEDWLESCGLKMQEREDVKLQSGDIWAPSDARFYNLMLSAIRL